jgi:carboxyl-terminal processing protease
MHKLSIERYKEMEDFVRGYVSRADYQIDESATLVIDPEKRGFPKGKAEREDLYRRLVHFQMSNYVANGEPLDEAKKKLIHRYELMTRRAQETKRDEIYARFLDAFSTSLDPHSSYLSPDNLEDFKIHMGLSLEGIGAVLSSRDGYTVVEEIVPGGSAAKEGTLKPKDKVIAVAQDEKGEMVDVIDMDLRDVVRMIRGKKGSVVRLSLLRQGATTERYTVRLVRDKINLEEQAAKLRFEEVKSGDRTYKLAVLDLPSFYGDKDAGARQATDDVQKLLKEARAAKADGLLLDLSRNGGGLLDYAVKITGFFIGKGGVVAVGDSQSRTQVLDDPDETIQWSGPLVVLTSRVTASAAEILAGAVKDYRRGVIVGDDHLREGQRADRRAAPARPRRAEAHDGALLPAGWQVDATDRCPGRHRRSGPHRQRRTRRDEPALLAAGAFDRGLRKGRAEAGQRLHRDRRRHRPGARPAVARSRRRRHALCRHRERAREAARQRRRREGGRPAREEGKGQREGEGEGGGEASGVDDGRRSLR